MDRTVGSFGVLKMLANLANRQAFAKICLSIVIRGLGAGCQN